MNFERNVNFMDRSRGALCHALRQLFTAQHMIVHVLHGLAGVFPAVVDDAVAALLQAQPVIFRDPYRHYAFKEPVLFNPFLSILLFNCARPAPHSIGYNK